MKKTFSVYLLTTTISQSTRFRQTRQPFIGTGGHGHTFQVTTVPLTEWYNFLLTPEYKQLGWL